MWGNLEIMRKEGLTSCGGVGGCRVGVDELQNNVPVPAELSTKAGAAKSHLPLQTTRPLLWGLWATTAGMLERSSSTARSNTLPLHIHFPQCMKL